jgi:cellulose synthase/poly-beta-1,6-N-acetylglucosamine synthase-like glycosyltransferase
VGAFEMAAPIGTDLALSRQLRAAGYSIRFVRESRVQMEYPETLADYRRQLSRWFRNPLVHETRWLTSPLARSHLWAGLAATVLVVTPLPALFSGSLRSLWTGSVLHLLLAQLRTHAVLQDMIGQQAPPLQTLRSCRYLPLGWALMAESLWSFLCCPKKEGQW